MGYNFVAMKVWTTVGVGLGTFGVVFAAVVAGIQIDRQFNRSSTVVLAASPMEARQYGSACSRWQPCTRR